MTQSEKSLLLKDLCGRLPYGVKIHINSCIAEQNQMRLFDVNLGEETIGVGNEKWAFRAISIINDEDETKVIKPYLRPMSSMTEEEKKEVSVLLNYEFYIDDDCALVAEDDRHRIRLDLMQVYIDWLNAHHFDYRGLIPKGIALPATAGMYNINNHNYGQARQVGS